MVTGLISPLTTWLGCAVCVGALGPDRHETGSRGAFLNFVCHAGDIVEAVALIHKECLENDLVIAGFEWLTCQAYLEREPSEYELRLIAKLPSHPVQFRNLHSFPVGH